MDPFSLMASVAPAAISAGSNLLGGILNRSSVNAANTANLNAAGLTDLYGLQWRAGDATAAEKATGINRLALLGVPAVNPPPAMVGDTSMGQSVANAGQDISRAAAALMSKQSRADVLNEELLQAKIDNVKADTVRMMAGASKLAMRDPAGQPPGVPLPPMRWIEGASGDKLQPLEQAFRDVRTGEEVMLPSEKAASPLQTLGALPVNVGMAARSTVEGINSVGPNYDFIPSGATLRNYYYRGFGY